MRGIGSNHGFELGHGTGVHFEPIFQRYANEMWWCGVGELCVQPIMCNASLDVGVGGKLKGLGMFCCEFLVRIDWGGFEHCCAVTVNRGF
ncbi:hypothetical protein CEXT_33361 [Caerostris extrusa]|uniref:Uncharacterized protein n=1 Tax=Caerostris extrusa TaxID=172846 RepID=A0AAV4T5I5_CAEEX|nr:hypothetical protein CEXT_33361 [Caerostris extrusa]